MPVRPLLPTRRQKSRQTSRCGSSASLAKASSCSKDRQYWTMVLQAHLVAEQPLLRVGDQVVEHGLHAPPPAAQVLQGPGEVELGVEAGTDEEHDEVTFDVRRPPALVDVLRHAPPYAAQPGPDHGPHRVMARQVLAPVSGPCNRFHTAAVNRLHDRSPPSPTRGSVSARDVRAVRRSPSRSRGRGAALHDRPGGRLTMAGRTAGPRPAVTLRDVAARAAVSTATASRALAGDTAISDPTRERVAEAARALDYRPHAAARSLRRRSTQLLGVLVTTSGDAYDGRGRPRHRAAAPDADARSSSRCPTSTAPGSGRRSRSSCTNESTASSPSPRSATATR